MERGTNAGYCTSSTYFFVLYIFSFVFSLSCPWILLPLSSLVRLRKLGSQKHRTAGWSMHLPYFTLVRSFWAASFAPSLRVAWLIFDFLPASLKVGWDIRSGSYPQSSFTPCLRRLYHCLGPNACFSFSPSCLSLQSLHLRENDDHPASTIPAAVSSCTHSPSARQH